MSRLRNCSTEKSSDRQEQKSHALETEISSGLMGHLAHMQTLQIHQMCEVSSENTCNLLRNSTNWAEVIYKVLRFKCDHLSSPTSFPKYQKLIQISIIIWILL